MERRAIIVGLCAAVGLGSLGEIASAQDAPVHWLTPPLATEEDYPAFASLIGVGGSVTLRCLSTVSGRVSDCQVLEAHPMDLGFENAAIVLTSRGVTEPARIDGLPYESTFTVRIPFTPFEERRGPRPERPDIPEPSAKALSLARQIVAAFGAGPTIQIPLGGLPLGRRDEVRGWANRDLVSANRVARDAVVQLIATALTEDEMMSMLKGGSVQTPARQDIIDLGEYLFWEVDIGAMLKAKYCANYEC
jgi:TonB family protein